MPPDNCAWTSKMPPNNPTCNHGVPGIANGLFWVDWYCHCVWDPANILKDAFQCDGEDLCAVFAPTETDVQRCVYFHVNVNLSDDDAQDY